MLKPLKNKTAFSLIELSIVILIIGIIVAGVTQSSRLISAFKLSTARNLTQSSPAASLSNMVLWFETTSEKSFIETEADNSLTVSQWNDINPTSNTKYTVTQATSGARPTYTTNCMNSLPCLRFSPSGVGDYFSFDGSFLVNSDYTVIVVEQRRSGSGTYNFFIGGVTAAQNQNLILGYRTVDTKLTFGTYSNDLDATIAAFSASNIIPRIHVFTFSSTSGKTLHLNGVSQSLAQAAETPQTPVPTAPITAFSGSSIGYYNAGVTVYYNGDLCEIMMFNRALKTEERRSIESYLSKKWNITVT